MPYANARVAVRRHDQLPAWLLDGWTEYSQRVTEAQLEDPELTKPPAELEISSTSGAGAPLV